MHKRLGVTLTAEKDRHIVQLSDEAHDIVDDMNCLHTGLLLGGVSVMKYMETRASRPPVSGTLCYEQGLPLLAHVRDLCLLFCRTCTI